jgi:dihydrofolate reductase
MVAWETMHTRPDLPPHILEFAEIWQGAEKIVYSRSLETVSSARTRLEREFDPEAVRRMKATQERDLLVGGADLAAQAIAAGLVDEYHVFLAPVLVGGGKRWLPDDVRVHLELFDQRRFGSGFVYLGYGPSQV